MKFGGGNRTRVKAFVKISAFVFCICVSTQLGEKSSAAPNGVVSSAQTFGITLGIQQPPAVNYGDEMNAVNSLTGKVHGLVLYYVDWYYIYGPFLENQLRGQMSASNVPVTFIAWEPTNARAANGCDQDYLNVVVPPDSIIAGACDDYIRAYANALKATGYRYLIKFAHEMNNSSRPWWPGNFGETPSTYVQMWRHVVDVFRSQNVTNVEWVWAPIFRSYPDTSANDVHLFYPGDNYVDWVGPMGYNYYTTLNWGWMTFSDIFDATLKDFACLYRKPQIIHEFGSVEGNASSPTKAQWITDAYLKAQNYPFLRSVVWYNDQDALNPNADFRITTHTGSANPPPPTNVNPLPSDTHAWTNAYHDAIASSVYTKTLPSKAAATPSNTTCPNKVYLPLILK